MRVVLLMLLSFLGYIVAYHTYGRFLARRIFGLDPDAPTPLETHADGIDFVPTRKGPPGARRGTDPNRSMKDLWPNTRLAEDVLSHARRASAAPF